MSNIKIFVSCRIDKESYCPDNQLFIPVRCGAIYDKSQSNVIGDNTGDNISLKRMSFNELTVQYWAWKNEDADYYGLCHYRRFLNFSNIVYPENYHCQVEIPGLNPSSAEKYGLMDKENMEALIEKYDAVVVKECPVRNIPTPMGFPMNVYELWGKHAGFLLLPEALQILLKHIKSIAPNMYSYATDYLKSGSFRGYNCFVMKKDLFEEMCNFEFPILFEVEKELNYEHATETTQRTCGYLAEILFSIFIYSLIKRNFKVKETQLFVFDETAIPAKVEVLEQRNCIVSVVGQHNYTSAAILLASLSKNCGSSHYHVIFMEHNLLPVMKQKILAANASKQVTVTFYNPLPILFLISEEFKDKDIEKWQFFIPWLLQSAKKVLYLDVNSVIVRDISKLFEMDLDHKMVAGVLDIAIQKALNNPYLDIKEVVSKLRRQDDYMYFDRSVLLINIDAMKKSLDTNRMINVLFGPSFCRCSGDFWNLFIRETDFSILNYEWNLHANWEDPLDRINNLSPIAEYQKWIAASTSPYIVVSGIWRNPDSPFSDFFWEIARCTNVYERILCEMYDQRISVPANGTVPAVDHRTGARKIADFWLPKGSLRRKVAKKILPKGSLRWRICKQIYFFIQPQVRPSKNIT